MRVKAKSTLAAAREAREQQIRAAVRRGGGRRGDDGGEGGDDDNGHGRERQNAAQSAMYDSSDSYENHVIDLRGDEYQSARAMNEDEEAPRDAHSGEEASLDGLSGHGEDGTADSTQATGNGALLNGIYGEHHHGAKGGQGLSEDIKQGPSKPRHHDFVSGQLVWAKFARFPWWPAQVLDERDAKEGTGGVPGCETDLLVRFFGTYDYGWVDPFNNLSDFDVKLTERSRIKKKALQKGVEEAIAWRDSGQLPDKWKQTTQRAEHKSTKTGYCDGAAELREQEDIKEPPVDDNESKERRAPRKRKPKVLFEEQGRVQKKPQRMLRRIRIMRQLGLVAPAGSPFTSE